MIREETEVKKDIKWLNNEVEKRVKKIKTDEVSFAGSDYFDEGYIHGMRDVQAIANQLDEPELPVIPQWVADNIETKKRIGTRLNVAMSSFPEIKLQKELDIDEYECNEIYARAWLDGYEVEEEPKYIIDTDDIEISDGNHYLTNLTLSKDSSELPIVGYKSDAIRFDDINQAQAIASYVGGRVEELEE